MSEHIKDLAAATVGHFGSRVTARRDLTNGEIILIAKEATGRSQCDSHTVIRMKPDEFQRLAATLHAAAAVL